MEPGERETFREVAALVLLAAQVAHQGFGPPRTSTIRINMRDEAHRAVEQASELLEALESGRAR